MAKTTKLVTMRGRMFLVHECNCGSVQCPTCDGGPGDVIVTNTVGNGVNPHTRIAVLELWREQRT